MTTLQPIVLASTSPYRRALLDRIGLPHVAVAPRFDETSSTDGDPKEIALLFADEKARSVENDHRSALIIGSDQTLSIDGKLARKPRGRADLLAQLMSLSGRSHELHTGLVVRDVATGRVARDLATVRLTMRTLGRGALERYVDLDAPLGCLGGYMFERRGVCLFQSVEGADDSAIVGLPLVSLTRVFAELGVEILDRLVPSTQSA